MWSITKDIVHQTLGKPEVMAHSRDWRTDSGKPAYAFQLRDDDGIVYFEGISTDNDSEDAFLPLDEYGASFGCTAIYYKNEEKGAWELL